MPIRRQPIDVPAGIVDAAGRRVPAIVNGKEQIPFQGLDYHRPLASKQEPPVRSALSYPRNGDKRVPDLRAAFARLPPSPLRLGGALGGGADDRPQPPCDP